jgi:hypothetical protein
MRCLVLGVCQDRKLAEIAVVAMAGNVLDEVSGGEWGEIVIWLSFPDTHYSYVQPHRSNLVSPLQKLRGKES